MSDIYGYMNEFERGQIIDKMDLIDSQILEEQGKKPEERNSAREFELMYAKFMAGLKLSTGARII